MTRQEPGFGGESFRRIAFLAAIASFGAVSQAQAAIYYWQDSGPGFTQAIPVAPPRQLRARHRDTRPAIRESESAKPLGPLVISISIAEQRLRLYDANGLFAESPVSTGMPDHPTPMGVFSVIQKQKFHQSNIYSGAPMPFMQRITWSGIALHAGVVPGRPASHGCIRMPAAFAVKMWNWTRMGARVVITPGPVAPAQFSHPLLAALKVLPQPVTADQPKSDVASAQKRGPANEVDAAHAAPEENAELHSTIWHEGDAKPVVAVLDGRATPPTQTADASSTLPASASRSNLASDASASSESAPRPTTGEADLASPPKAEAVVNTPAEDEIKPDNIKPQPAPKPDPTTLIKRSGQIAIFVSRKDSKIYVRQNFSPLFDLPVTITADERPLGTHIFTAQVDRSDANVLHWSVISLPAPGRLGERLHQSQHLAHGHKVAKPAAIEAKAQPLPDGPAEALDRINLPAETMARIFEAISTGGSIIVSDQGIGGGETGEGTDFIVSLR